VCRAHDPGLEAVVKSELNDKAIALFRCTQIILYSAEQKNPR
jgi:hypothetical protein